MASRLPPWILLHAALGATALYAAGPRMRVLESSPGRMRVEILAPGLTVEEVPGGGGIRLSCPGCRGAREGAPDLPVHRFEVPTRGPVQVRIEILASEAVDLGGRAVAAVPITRPDRTLEYRMDPALAEAATRLEARPETPTLIRGAWSRGVGVPLARLDRDGGLANALRRLEVEAIWEPVPRASVRGPRAAKRGAARPAADLGETFLRIRVGDSAVETLHEDGWYAVGFADLVKASKSLQGGVRIADLRLYRGARDSLPRRMEALPEGAADMPGALREIPLEVDDDGDSVFDAGDTLRFYAHGTSHWKRVPGTADPVRYAFAADPWSYVNAYWLAWSGAGHAGPALRIATAGPGEPSSRAARSVARDYFRAEREVATGGCEIVGLRDSAAGYVWYWHRRGVCHSMPDTVLRGSQLAGGPGAALADYAPGDSVYVSLHTFPAASADDFKVWVGGDRTPLPFSPGDPAEGSRYAWAGPPGPLPDGESAFRPDSVHWGGSSRNLEGYSVSYPRRLAWRGRPLRILPDADGPQAWRVEGGGGLGCLRLVDGVADRRLALDREGRFADDPPPGGDVQYLVFGAASPLPGGALSGGALPAQGGPLRDLLFSGRARNQVPEYLIVAPEALLVPALALRDHRRGERRARPMGAEVVLVEDIQRVLGSGRSSPTAIRDFLRWAFHRWPAGDGSASPLSHVVLFGGGHFDYRGIASAGRTDAPPNHVPAYEGFSGEYSIATDDFYARLDSGETDFMEKGMDLAVGRVPARTAAEAAAYVEKVKAWDDPAQAGEWRARAVLAADDHLQRGQPGNLDGIPEGHTNDAEDLGKTMAARDPSIFLERVYLIDYPMNSSYRKPEAAQDLIGFLNRGAIAVNYVGHGSANQWADEVLLQTADALSALKNRGRTPMINSFSCAVGRFDAFVPGMSETLVARAGTGAIAALSATRESYSNPNVALAHAFFGAAMPADSAPPLTIGEALRVAKNTRGGPSNPVNDSKYHILGDPGLLLRKPPLGVILASRPDTLRSLDCGRFEGTIRGGSGQGFVNIKLVSGSERKVYPMPGGIATQRVDKRGSVIFERTVPYREGSFSVEYLIPARIPFGDSGASLAVFAWDAEREMEGSAAADSLRLSGRTGDGPCAADQDGKGPRILITGCEAKEAGGLDLPGRVRLALPSCLQITVEDSSGGIVSAEGPDEGTTFEIPGVLDPFHPRAGLDGLYQKTFRLGLERKDIRPGSYLLKVVSQDGYGNRSRRELRMDLTQDSSIQTVLAYNAPNPVKRNGTAFYFSTLLPSPEVFVEEGGGAPTARVEFEVRIHDQAGRLVKALRNAHSGQRWDGRDEWGNRVANGVYFYTVTARWLQTGGMASGHRVLSTRRNTLVMSR